MSRGIQVPADSCISVTTVMVVSQLVYRAYVTKLTSCGHVDIVDLWDRKSCETYWIDATGATYDDACDVWGHSPVNIDSHKLSSWKVVHQCKHVNTHWWTTVQLLILWLLMLTGLWPQTTHASSVAPVRSSKSGGLTACVCGSNFY